MLADARALEAAGQPQAAGELTQAVLRLLPDDPGAVALLAALTLRQAGPDAARPWLERAHRLAPDDADTLVLLAACDQAQGHAVDAERRYRQVLAMAPAPAHITAAGNLGALLLTQGRAADALAPLSMAATLAPADAGAFYNRAHALRALDRLGDALADFQRTVALAPAFVPGWTGLALTARALGRTDAALAALDRVLELEPQVAGGYFNRAQLLDQMGRLPEAAAAAAEATRLDPGQAAYHHLHAVILCKLGRQAQAAAASRTALALLGRAAVTPATPADRVRAADMWCQLGLALSYDGQTAAAREALNACLFLQDGHAGALDTLATLSRDEGRLDDALARHTHLFALLAARGESPTPDMHNNHGCTLLALRRPAEAADAFRAAIGLDRDYAEALSNLGNALRSLQRPDDAIACYHAALALRPNAAELHSNLGNVLKERGRLAEALDAYRQAVRHNPDFAGGWLNLAMAVREDGDLTAAEAAARRALSLLPSPPDGTDPAPSSAQDALAAQVWMVLGTILHDANRLDEAIAANERSLRLRPDGVEANWNLSLLLLLTGQYERGWRQYETRRRGRNAPRSHFTQPDWDGGPFPGRTLLVHIEQGIGDALMAVRYLPLVAARGGTVLLETPAEVMPVMAGLPALAAPGRVILVPDGGPLPPFDLQTPIMSLPGLFQAGQVPIPATIPYLSAPAERRRHWRQRLERIHGADSRPRVGVVWAGNAQFIGDRWRSPRLPAFAPLLAEPGVRFYGLQLGDGRRDLAGAALPPDFVDLGPEIADFGDTAAILEEMDLLISSCTSPVHMAGALGRPVWVVLPQVPDWRWGTDGDGSVWYPTARLYRQRRRDDWTPVMRTAAADLAAWARKNPRGGVPS